MCVFFVGLVMCVCVCFVNCVYVYKCGFCDVCFCVCLSFVMCGCVYLWLF